MKSYSGSEFCRVAGSLAMVFSVVLGVLISFVLTGFALMFFGIVFVIGLVTLGVGLALRRSSAKTAAS